ncbi:MAG: DUF5694 domain-containing protein [Sphingomonadales bacterium]|nr:DUF5694 domain-containing protein [Sphingomonadales bacterium]
MKLSLVSLFLAAGLVAAPVSAQQAEPVEVMILGSYHFANPGRDLANMEVDDVTTPRRQREIEALVDALAQWQPDKILIESEQPGPDFHVSDYAEFSPAMLAERRNESVQIGYRLAHRLGHPHVYGFDEQPGENEPDYFPYGPLRQWAEEHGMAARLDAMEQEIQARVAAEGAAQAETSIPASLIEHNDRAASDGQHAYFYYGLFDFGDGEAQPGAELNAYWFLRNAKMFAKIGLIVEPGERVLVIVGSGHGFWLRHLAEQTPGYELIDVVPLLRAAADALASEREAVR